MDVNEIYELLQHCRGNFMAEGVNSRSDIINRFWLKLKIKENLIFQKSRIKWDSEGDANIRFFQSTMKEGGT